MSEQVLQLHFQIQAAPYKKLIAALMHEAEKHKAAPDAKARAARRQFFIAAISKGVELADLPEFVAGLDTALISDAAAKLFDKKAMGWGTSEVYLRPEDRAAFAAAAAKRHPAVQWDHLFTQGAMDLVLPLMQDPQSVETKIETFIQRHNERAGLLYAEAVLQDSKALEKNPLAKPVAGRSRDHWQIRRDPEALSKLQYQDPSKPEKGWQTGPRLGKFLQEKLEWDLYDIFQMENDASSNKTRTEEPRAEGDVGVQAIAHHKNWDADGMLSKLRLVITRDPQKIGEMSTGQRWASCMARGASNFDYVLKDIEKGTLVAYLVHQDDPEARYPSMRCSIKPYRNDQGEVVLVPSKIYGGAGNGNALAREAFRSSIVSFVQEKNRGKNGTFILDPELYADAQATLVATHAAWPAETIKKALIDYQKGALHEYMIELKNNFNWQRSGEKGPFGEDPAGNIKKLKSKIRRLMDSQDQETGLPRMFYRQMLRTSMGTLPTPSSVLEILAQDKPFGQQMRAFKALVKNDETSWAANAQALTSTQRVTTLLAFLTTEEKQGADQQWILDTLKNEGSANPLDLLNTVIDVVPQGTPMAETCFDILDHHIIGKGTPTERAGNALRFFQEQGIRQRELSPLTKYACERALNEIPLMPSFENRLFVAQFIVSATQNFWNPLRKDYSGYDDIRRRAVEVKIAEQHSSGWFLAPPLRILRSVVEASRHKTSLARAVWEGFKVSLPEVLIPGMQEASFPNYAQRPVAERFLYATETIMGSVSAFALLSLHGSGLDLPVAGAAGAATFAIQLVRDVVHATGHSLTGGPVTEIVSIFRKARDEVDQRTQTTAPQMSPQRQSLPMPSSADQLIS